MPGVSVEEGAAVHRIASGLADSLTNSSISQAASAFRLKAEGTNKPTRLASLLFESFALTKLQRERLVASLVLEAHRLHTAGKTVLSEETVDSAVSDMRVLGLSPGELASKKWRKGLARATAPPPASPSHTAASSPTRHDALLGQLAALLAPGTNPQARGRELEEILHGALVKEGLGPEKNIMSPGEEIDLGFTVAGAHYLLQSKWEASAIGFPVVEAFMARVNRKAEGTFGVVLSMSGFVRDINLKASRGARLNCIGLTHASLMAVLEGRSTWATLVSIGRRAASTRSHFLSEGL